MSVAYVDTSSLVAIAFAEPGYGGVADRLNSYSQLLSSNLLEAEMRAAFARENREFDRRRLIGLRWIIPDRPLSPEFSRVLDIGYVRGADLWHLATALHVARAPEEMAFITLDDRQQILAGRLGFDT
ncbi:PIN domain-containing protein [Candidatus Spongiisocius sp.]|uniref:PIN domain-containing protein n=1 Tax=Candidatus Spongiisocius sp. TaxID=3101273 RepID=UPI003B5B2712